MEILSGNFGLRKMNNMQYPLLSIAVAVVLLYLAPFVSPLLVFVSFVICACRMVLYDARVFATDYAVMVPIAALFSYNGMSLLIYLCLLAALWYFFTDELPKQMPYAVLLILLNYLLLRMNWNISRLVLCFGQLAFLCVMLPKQDSDSAERAVKLFCINLLLSSVYALVLRNSSQIYAIRGPETPAYWSSAINRFQGLLQDPNYYMTTLLTAMTLLLRLYDCKKIKLLHCVLLEAALCFFGMLTYSKTFFLALVLLVVVGIFWLFLNKKYLLGMAILVGGLLMLHLFSDSDSSIGIVLFRLKSANNLAELTTGRSEVFARYYQAITKDLGSFLFGAGLSASNLGKDPHNLYLEIGYYIGAVGFGILVWFVIMMLSSMKKKLENEPKQNFIAKYVVLFMVLILHFSLHGMFSTILYAVFFFAFLSMVLTKKEA